MADGLRRWWLLAVEVGGGIVDGGQTQRVQLDSGDVDKHTAVVEV